MRAFTIKTRGLEQVLTNMAKMNSRIAEGIDDELDIAARNVEAEARTRAKGRIASGIHADTRQKFRKTVGSTDPNAAFVEFGTGPFVFAGAYSFTADEKKFARLFYVSGKGTTKSHAAVFPAFHEEIPRLQKRIQDVIKKAIVK